MEYISRSDIGPSTKMLSYLSPWKPLRFTTSVRNRTKIFQRTLDEAAALLDRLA